MKTILSAPVGLLFLLLPSIAFSAPNPAPTPPHILVTLQVIEAPAAAVSSITFGPGFSAAKLSASLMKNAASEATEISVQTTADFPGIARYNRVLAFTTQGGGKPSRGFLDAPMSLEATPHVNADGTLTISLNTTVTKVNPTNPRSAGGLPPVTTQSLTTRHTFKAGETFLLGVPLSVTPRIAPGQDEMVLVQFVTVTVLPGRVAAR